MPTQWVEITRADGTKGKDRLTDVCKTLAWSRVCHSQQSARSELLSGSAIRCRGKSYRLMGDKP
jgi:hypothetical protein